ncbi:MAG: hypothetical protein Tsb0020_02150 [Haliangiales bacterium]
MEQFGKYQLLRRIGVGGMAEVFLARTAVAQGLSKELVIKKIHPDFARSQRFLSMFIAEAEIALGLNHPNIVQVFDFGTANGTFFLAMEHIAGMDLLRMLESARDANLLLPLEIAAFVVQEMARGLDYAHRKADAFGAPLAIVHRDVSLQNVLVSWDGAVKIVDFGVARARGVTEAPGAVKGKLRYMSPEQARGEAVDRRADVFSSGVVLFELCCGRPLYADVEQPGDGPAGARMSRDLLTQVKAGAIVRPRDINPHISEALEAVMLKALAFHPDDRFQSARELQTALGRFLLAQAQVTGELTDGAVLAKFLRGLAPEEERMPTPAEPLARGTGALEGSQPALPDMARTPGPLTVSDALTAADDTGSTPPPRPRSGSWDLRKHVLFLVGRLVTSAGCAPSSAPGEPDGQAGWDVEWAQVAADIAYKYDARLIRVDADSVELVVGAPVSAENDATRAVRAALALIEAVDVLGRERAVEVRLAVGIQRGMAVLSAPQRAAQRPRATSEADHIELVSGSTQVAHRLAEQATRGEVWVSSGVYQAARQQWHFDELGEIALADGGEVFSEVSFDHDDADSGGADSYDDGEPRVETGDERDGEPGVSHTRYYRLRAPIGRNEHLRALARNQSALIGRELEYKALRDAYRDVVVRRGKRNVLLAGEVGVGKRALVNAFVRSVPAGEAIVLRAITRLATAYTPYALIGDLARDLLGLDDGASAALVQRQLERLAEKIYPTAVDDRDSRRVIDVLYRLLTGFDHQPPIRAGSRAPMVDDTLDADERRQRIWQAIVRAEQQMAPGRPLVVIVEDAHWSDDESLALFRELLRLPTSRPVLGVITSRPDTRVAAVAAEVTADIVRIEALDTESAISLVTRRFVPDGDGEQPPVRELARQIVTRTGGYPFFIIEVLHSLRERGVVVEEPDGRLRWVDRKASLGIPSTVEGFLATRVDGLPDSEREVLMCAAVLGRACTPEALGEILQRSAQADLDALVERGLMSRREGLYAFASDMLLRVAYELIPADERTRLHLLAAARLHDPARYRPGYDDALIARHRELAGDTGAAADDYLRAASHAARVGGNDDALRQLGRALKLLPATDAARRFRVHAQREEILHRLARPAEQLRAIQSMGEMARALDDPACLARAHARLADYHLDTGAAADAMRAVTAALRYAREAKRPLIEAEALRLRASVVQVLGQGVEALSVADSALALCDESPAGLKQRARILTVRGTVLWHMGRLETAIESHAEALVIHHHLHEPRLEAQALNNMGNIFAAMGEFEEALAHYKRSLKVNQRLGDRSSIALKLGNIGQTYSELGDIKRAERYLRRALALAAQLEDARTEADAAISLGQVLLEREQSAAAARLFERGLIGAQRGKNRYMEIRARIYLALAHIRAGRDADAALALARTAIAQAEKMPMPVGQTFGHMVEGLALAALGRADEAADASLRAVTLQSGLERPEGAEQILYTHATLCEGAGRLGDARAVLRLAAGEVELKAGRLRDPELRRLYLESAVPTAIAAMRDRLSGADEDREP